MSTVINNDAPTERVIEKSDSSGWAVAVVILLAVVAAGAYAWVHYRRPAAPAQGTTINVNVPTGGNNTPATQ